MSTSPDTVAVLLRLPRGVVERVDSIAKAEDRSRTYVARRALQAYCDSLVTPAQSDTPTPRIQELAP
jgi:predicted transcriptional regulator